MEIVKGYFDYCISEQCIKSGDFEKMAKLLLEFPVGYRTVAINQIIDEGHLESKKKKKKREPGDAVDVVPQPIDLKKYEGNGELKLLNRLTIIFSNQDIIHKIVKSQNYTKYHIVAVLPTTQAAFQFTCSNIDADILTFDPENRIPYKLSRKLYNQLVQKGFHLEILYGPATQDSSQRKNVIHVSHSYHSYGKSKNIIISSGARNPMMIRGPYDIICLGAIFGLNSDQSKNALMQCGKKVFLNSVARKLRKSAIFVENMEQEENVAMEVSEEEESGEDMALDQPVQKKQKQ